MATRMVRRPRQRALGAPLTSGTVTAAGVGGETLNLTMHRVAVVFISHHGSNSDLRSPTETLSSSRQICSIGPNTKLLRRGRRQRMTAVMT